MLMRDRNRDSIDRFVATRAEWPGWSADHEWPIRVPSGGIEWIEARAADLAAEAMDVGSAKLWRRGSAIEKAVAVWPSLDSFCWGNRAAADARGGRP